MYHLISLVRSLMTQVCLYVLSHYYWHYYVYMLHLEWHWCMYYHNIMMLVYTFLRFITINSVILFKLSLMTLVCLYVHRYVNISCNYKDFGMSVCLVTIILVCLFYGLKWPLMTLYSLFVCRFGSLMTLVCL